ncbi:MAG TPA: DUF4404 family protein [Anaerolineaceae bacterium]|nr:DUF4404 family protein [Anaerolineaceae bacterium]
MDEKELRNLLEKLHGEIERTETIDDKGRALLDDLDSDIRALLSRSGRKPIKPQPSTVQRVEESIDYLEVTHPTLTSMLSQLLATLSNTGI